MRRIFPEPAGETTVDELYGDPRPPPADRPWVGICMVVSLDGSTVVDGRSGGLSSPTDLQVLLRLRAAADVILVGASTVRQEGYGPPRTPDQRIGVVTRRGDLDMSVDLFTSGAGFLVLPEDGPPAPRTPDGRPVDVVRAGRRRVDVRLALDRLTELVGPLRFVQVEGGPHLNGSLLDADCVDELNMTVAPVLVGGDGGRLTAGAAPAAHRFDLGHLAVDELSFTFTRWLRHRDR